MMWSVDVTLTRCANIMLPFGWGNIQMIEPSGHYDVFFVEWSPCGILVTSSSGHGNVFSSEWVVCRIQVISIRWATKPSDNCALLGKLFCEGVSSSLLDHRATRVIDGQRMMSGMASEPIVDVILTSRWC